MASPISHICTSMPAALMPVFVASFTAARRGSNFGSNATVQAQSMIRPERRTKNMNKDTRKNASKKVYYNMSNTAVMVNIQKERERSHNENLADYR